MNYLINKHYWGNGYATEALNKIVEYVFSELNKEVVFAGYFDKNIASGKVLAKCGFEFYGQINNAKIWYEDNQPTNLIWTKLTKQNFIIQ